MATPDAEQPARRLRIAFVSTMCLLDRVSGAAIPVRSALWDDAATYRCAAERARAAGQRFTPEATRARALEIFEGFAAARVARQG